MISFVAAFLLLILGYVFYVRLIEENFGPDDRKTPAMLVNDGTDYVPMPTWKIFLIQLLNIAGTGPIFGALSGAIFGPVVYLWIVLGCVFAGSVHDYMSGMVSVRHVGASIAEIVGFYLGNKIKTVMRIFSVILLILIGIVFSVSPAGLLALLTPEWFDAAFWLWVILAYYFVATFLPVDKLIGRVYPLFGLCLIITIVGISGSLLFSGEFAMPELWDSFRNMHAEKLPVWPFMFITVACGAVSGFHGTQSPMMSRCIKSEYDGRIVFAGAMICEGVIALVWAAAGVSCYESSQALLEAGGGCSAVVYHICQTTMGRVGCVLAMLGIIVCPVSSGDTAFRAVRLSIADWFDIKQTSVKNRFMLTVPILAIGAVGCHVDYGVLWRYASWANQTLATFSLWAFACCLAYNGKNWLCCVVPAVFMTALTTAYFFYSRECVGGVWRLLGVSDGLAYNISVGIGIVLSVVFLALFLKKVGKMSQLEK
ncbi:MAG: carbon starvation CstA family protein [Synergistes sp.]|nr:carbon starvation CstA family protein [Synergistes sp.]